MNNFVCQRPGQDGCPSEGYLFWKNWRQEYIASVSAAFGIVDGIGKYYIYKPQYPDGDIFSQWKRLHRLLYSPETATGRFLQKVFIPKKLSPLFADYQSNMEQNGVQIRRVASLGGVGVSAVKVWADVKALSICREKRNATTNELAAIGSDLGSAISDGIGSLTYGATWLFNQSEKWNQHLFAACHRAAITAGTCRIISGVSRVLVEADHQRKTRDANLASYQFAVQDFFYGIYQIGKSSDILRKASRQPIVEAIRILSSEKVNFVGYTRGLILGTAWLSGLFSYGCHAVTAYDLIAHGDRFSEEEKERKITSLIAGIASTTLILGSCLMFPPSLGFASSLLFSSGSIIAAFQSDYDHDDQYDQPRV